MRVILLVQAVILKQQNSDIDWHVNFCGLRFNSKSISKTQLEARINWNGYFEGPINSWSWKQGEIEKDTIIFLTLVFLIKIDNGPMFEGVSSQLVKDNPIWSYNYN